MEDYKIIETIGDGSFGTVMRASHIKTGEIVAIKKMKKKFNSWDECMSLRELKSLSKLKNHQNIIKLKEALRVKDELFFIFEFMEQNLYQLYTQMKESGNPFTENQIRTIMFQTTSGLAYMHKHGFFHRDLKPENLLISAGVTKIADFGLAREIRSRPPFTDYVATRWYRAPEILLKAPNYNSPVDIFALGCIMAELYLGAPLFKGNNELEQMYKICSILGTPTQTTWSDGCRQAAQIGFTFPQCTPVSLSSLMPNASDDAIQLMTEMLQFDPQKRPSSSQILQHPFFANYVPTTKGFAPTGNHIIRVPSGSRKSKMSESADERFIKKPHHVKETSYSVKHAHTEEDEHLGILEDLEVEAKNLAKQTFVSSVKKPEKTLEVEKLNSLEENTDALLAEIEAVVNSDKQDTNLQYNNKASFGFNKNFSTHSKPTLTSTMSTGNMKAPISTYGMMDYSQKSGGDIFDKGWGMGPSSFDLLQKNTPTYGKTTQFGQQGNGNANGNAGDFYKYNNSPHWNQGQNNISNRGAHIMNAFVYSSNKNIGAGGNLAGSNLATSSFKSGGYGQIEDTEGFSKFGY